MLFLDYSEDRSIYGSLDDPEYDTGKGRTLSLDDEDTTHIKEAKIHIDTLSSFKGFGGGTYKMTMVKKMTATEDFLKMPPGDRKCEVERYEECRAGKIIDECNCDSLAIFGAQVTNESFSFSAKCSCLMYCKFKLSLN